MLAEIFAALDASGVESRNSGENVIGVINLHKARYGDILAPVDPSSKQPFFEGDWRELLAYETSVQINQALGRPFTLSLTRGSGPRTSYPSWAPDWGVSKKTYLLNSPAECFQASSIKGRDQVITRGGTLECGGIAIGTVRATAGYLPPRRHSDHYTVSGGNSFFFGEWFEFAENMSSRLRRDSRDPRTTLLDFAETIQAKGCSWKFAAAMPAKPDEYISLARKFLDFLEDEDIEETYDIRLFYAACYPSHDRVFGITSSGRFCLLPKGAKVGDAVCIPHGSNVPVILRKIGDYFHNVGEAYVHGLMHGEAYAVDGVEHRSFLIK